MAVLDEMVMRAEVIRTQCSCEVVATHCLPQESLKGEQLAVLEEA